MTNTMVSERLNAQYEALRKQGERQLKWDQRFLTLAEMISTWSKDPSTQCGGVIVRPDKSIVSVGFNGFPRQIADLPELLNTREEKYKRVVHSEMNAILNAQGPVKGFTLYNWPGQSCSRCAVHVIQAGIERVVTPELDSNSPFVKRWIEDMKLSEQLFAEAGVEVVYVLTVSHSTV